MGEVYGLAEIGAEIGPGQEVLDRAQHQGQGSPELVADIGEEGGLGAVELGQRLGPASRLLVGPGIGEPGRDLARHEVDEAGIGGVEGAVGVDAGDQAAGRSLMALMGDGDEDGPRGWPVPGAGGQVGEAGGEIVDRHRCRARQELRDRPCLTRGLDVDRLRRRGLAVLEADGAGESRPFATGLQQIEEGEGEILAILGELAADGGDRLLGARPGELGPEFAQELEAALAQDPLGLLGDDAEHPAHGTGIVGHGAVGEGVVGFLGVAAAFQEEEEALVIGGDTGRHDGLDAGTDILPDLGPDQVRRRAQRPGLLDAQGRPVGVVAEEGQLRAPGEPHGIARGEHDANDDAQALRPGLGRTQRCGRPVIGAHELAHLAAAREEVRARGGSPGWRAILQPPGLLAFPRTNRHVRCWTEYGSRASVDFGPTPPPALPGSPAGGSTSGGRGRGGPGGGRGCRARRCGRLRGPRSRRRRRPWRGGGR